MSKFLCTSCEDDLCFPCFEYNKHFWNLSITKDNDIVFSFDSFDWLEKLSAKERVLVKVGAYNTFKSKTKFDCQRCGGLDCVMIVL